MPKTQGKKTSSLKSAQRAGEKGGEQRAEPENRNLEKCEASYDEK